VTVTIAWWDLTDSDVTIETLEQDMRTSIDAWHEVEGLRVKLWIADRQNRRWGAVMWWDQHVPVDQPLPPNRAAELIGRPPSCRARFDLVATAEGTPPASRDRHRDRLSRAE
jgi:hypothetical protein